MTSIKVYPVRFIADEHFIAELIENKEEATDILFDLSLINKTSKDYSLIHNSILDESFIASIRGKPIRGDAILGAFHPVKCPSSLAQDDGISKVIRYGILMANKKPWKIIILTSSSKKEEYVSNDHYTNVASAIKIASPSEIKLLTKYLIDLNGSH